MTMARFALAITLLSLSVPAAGLAQEASGDAQRPVAVEIPPPQVIQELRLRDGSCLFGRVTAIEIDTITFRTEAGADATVRRADIISLTIVEGRSVKGEFLPPDSNTTRLFFGPTGRTLPRGQGYLGVYEIFMPTVQVGLTDRISVGGGTPLLFGDGDGRPYWVTPKVQVYASERVAVAAGLIHFFVTGLDRDFGIAYGAATIGRRDSAVTIGVGRAYRTGPDGGSTTVLMVGDEQRVNRRLKLITENYLWKEGGILSGGVRFLGDRLSADLGLVLPLNAGEAIGFPFVNFVWMFR